MRSLTSSNEVDATLLIQAAQGGRVAHTGFLEPQDSAELIPKLRQSGVSVYVSGGFPGARRRIITVFPDSIPEADTQVKVYYSADAQDESLFRTAIQQHLKQEQLGDIIKHQDGLSIVTLANADLPSTIKVEGRPIELEEVSLERVVSGSRKQQVVIVPSLRVDALGAKAFNVSRSYFSKGIKAGNVTLNGKQASKSSSAEAGDEIYAETIGRMHITSVQGETRRGNLKVLVDIEKA